MPKTPYILLLDHYDSFTYNIYQYLCMLEIRVLLRPYDDVKTKDAVVRDCDAIILSPGPGSPKDVKESLDIIDYYASKKPFLGVCLGHQLLAYYFGAHIINAKKIMHAKTSIIKHDKKGIYQNLSDTFVVARYHSLLIDPSSLPKDLIISSRAIEEQGENDIMGIRHQHYALEGVQFHPEAIESEYGHDLFKNFLRMV